MRTLRSFWFMKPGVELRWSPSLSFLSERSKQETSDLIVMVKCGRRWTWKERTMIILLLALVNKPGHNVEGLFWRMSEGWTWSRSPLSEQERVELREKAREMFQFGYDHYMRHAFPLDELDPIHCTGRGPDYEDPSNININDVLGDYCLGLVDSLDTLAVLGNRSEFFRAVRLVTEYVSFDKDSTVQVFEATIRVLGALLSAHLILTDSSYSLGDFYMTEYNDELLTLAHDLASRLLPAFEGTATGIPHPRVNLMYGVPWNSVNETCTAGAGSLLLEFGVLSRLLGDPTYEGLARRTNRALWELRDKDTGLLGNVVNIQTGEWQDLLSGLGAGIDSFYEYLIKAYILFGDPEDFRMFNQSYAFIKEHLRRGRANCNEGAGDPPLYVNVHMRDGSTVNTWVDSLQASFTGVQILAGDLDEAICQHALFYSIWKKYGVLPERFNWHLKAPDVGFYPLRPEFAEATYLLYRSTLNPFYLHVGKEIIASLNEHTRVRCGFATVHDVHDKSLEDRMESFFLSETCKYLFLLYDFENPVNRNYDRVLYTTEGHVLPLDGRFRDWSPTPLRRRSRPVTNSSLASCQQFPHSRRFLLPLRSHYSDQFDDMVGVYDQTFSNVDV